jgi:hypothetical protein
MMTMTEGFIGRWARRKRAVETPDAAEEEAPPLESLALEEIAGWLKRNVPQAWKLAALRRLWMEDAAIRGFVGPADYAWDWNTPGGAPFFGPMGAADDLKTLLARAMGSVAEPVAVAPPAEPEQVIAVTHPEVAPAPVAREPVFGRRRGGGATPV